MPRNVRRGREAAATVRRLRHEMRTSLGQIMGFTEILQEEVEDRKLPELRGDLDKIHGAARKLLELVDQMLSPGDTSPRRTRRMERGVVDDGMSNRTSRRRRLSVRAVDAALADEV